MRRYACIVSFADINSLDAVKAISTNVGVQPRYRAFQGSERIAMRKPAGNVIGRVRFGSAHGCLCLCDAVRR